VTCRDSVLLKTMAHESLRPLADAGDCALGVAGQTLATCGHGRLEIYFNALPVGPSDTNELT